MKRFLISFGAAFLAALSGYLYQTLPIYLSFVAHQPGKVPDSQAYSFSPNTAFFMASPLWIPFWFGITAVIWTAWTLFTRDAADPKFPVRLLVFYVLCIVSIPTIVVVSDFGNLQATEEEWNWVIGWSYLLIGPVLAALYLALRNFRRMPVLAVATALFALFHCGTTIAGYGWIPSYVPDFRFGYDEATGKVDLDMRTYFQFSLELAVPFLFVYCLWRFWLGRKACVVEQVA